jgi:hypothetical protein
MAHDAGLLTSTKLPRTLPAERLSGPGRIAREKLAPVMTEARKGCTILHGSILFEEGEAVKQPHRHPASGQLLIRFSAIVSQ